MFSSDKFIHALLATIFVVGVSGCGREAGQATDTQEPAADQTAHDDHASHESPTLPEGSRWPTDAPLREAMNRIGAAVEQSEMAYGNGAFKEPEAQQLATQIEKDVQFMIENCKLAPDADAALHVLIARMLSAAQTLKANPTSHEGVPALASVVHDYQATFDQAGEHEAH